MTTTAARPPKEPLPNPIRSFIFGEPRVATEKDCKLNWYSGKPGEGFRCCFCGYKFVVGDYWRCQFSNDVPGAGGNPLVCQSCDAPKEELIVRWKAMRDEFNGDKFWAFRMRS